VWNSSAQWKGWLLAAEQAGPPAYPALLSLPPSVLAKALTAMRQGAALRPKVVFARCLIRLRCVLMLVCCSHCCALNLRCGAPETLLEGKLQDCMFPLVDFANMCVHCPVEPSLLGSCPCHSMKRSCREHCDTYYHSR
jgi:hypothetical protein